MDDRWWITTPSGRLCLINRRFETRPYTISANLPGRSGRLKLDDEPGKSGKSIEGRPGFRPRLADLGEPLSRSELKAMAPGPSFPPTNLVACPRSINANRRARTFTNRRLFSSSGKKMSTRPVTWIQALVREIGCRLDE